MIMMIIMYQQEYKAVLFLPLFIVYIYCQKQKCNAIDNLKGACNNLHSTQRRWCRL